MNHAEWWKQYPEEMREKFLAFHTANPEFYRKFARLAVEMKATGRKHYSPEAICRVVCWQIDLLTNAKPFKISAAFIPIYARLLIFNKSEFDGFFLFRKRKGN